MQQQAVSRCFTVTTVHDGVDGAQGFGIVASVLRDNFNESHWATYAEIGHTETWNYTEMYADGTNSGVMTSSIRNGCRVGDYFIVYGTAKDTGNSHRATYRSITDSGNLRGECVSHEITNAGSSPWIADIDNEMDGVSCADSGYVVRQQSVKTGITLYYGSDKQNFKVSSVVRKFNTDGASGRTYTSNTAYDGVTVNLSAGFNTAALSNTLTVTYDTSAKITSKDEFVITLTDASGNNQRKLSFTVKGFVGEVYNLLLPHKEIIATLNADGTYTVDGSSTYPLSCGYSKNVDGTITEYATVPSAVIDGRYGIFYCTHLRSTGDWNRVASGTWKGHKTYTRLFESDMDFVIGSTTYQVSRSKINLNNVDAVEFAIVDYQSIGWADEGHPVFDHEIVYVVNNGRDGASGSNSVRIDLDNQADIISLDDLGKVRYERTVTLHAKIYDGASAVTSGVTNTTTDSLAIGDCTPATSLISGVLTVTWTFAKGVSASAATKTIKLTYKSVEYSAVFTLGTTNDSAVYQLVPTANAISFNRNTDNTLTPASVNVSCGYVKITADGVSPVSAYTVAATQNIDGKYTIYYRYIKSDGTSDGWVKPSYNTTLVIANSTTYAAAEYALSSATAAASVVDGNIIDRETVPITKDGAKGDDGASPWIADLDNEMDGVSCDEFGHPADDQSVSANVSLFCGKISKSFTITSIVRMYGTNGSTKTWTSSQTGWSGNGGVRPTWTSGGAVTIYYSGSEDSSTSKTIAAISGKDVFTINLRAADDSTITRQLTLTVNGIIGDVYNLMPSVRQIIAEQEDGVYKVDGSRTFALTCGYTKNVNGVLSAVADSSEQHASGGPYPRHVDGKYNIWFHRRLRSTGDWEKNGATDDNMYISYNVYYGRGYVTSFDVNIYDAIEFLLSTQTGNGVATSNDANFYRTCVDRETVYVVANGPQGDAALPTNPNLMDGTGFVKNLSKWVWMTGAVVDGGFNGQKAFRFTKMAVDYNVFRQSNMWMSDGSGIMRAGTWYTLSYYLRGNIGSVGGGFYDASESNGAPKMLDTSEKVYQNGEETSLTATEHHDTLTTSWERRTLTFKTAADFPSDYSHIYFRLFSTNITGEITRNSFTSAQWDDFGVIGKSTTWTGAVTSNYVKVNTLITISGTATDTGEKKMITSRVTSISGSDATATVVLYDLVYREVSCIKLEEGMEATPWCLSENDKIGVSPESYIQTQEAWSNKDSSSDAGTMPSDCVESDWKDSTPPNSNSRMYLWRRSRTMTLNSDSTGYAAGSWTYTRLSGTNGASLKNRGAVANASKRNGTGGSGTGTAGTAVLTSGTTITMANGEAVIQQDNGHMYQWLTEGGSQWHDLGQFKGDSGDTYFTHLAWAKDITLGTPTSSRTTGQKTTPNASDIGKNSSDVPYFSISPADGYDWMGILIDKVVSDSDNWIYYTWKYTKGTSPWIADLDNEMDSVPCEYGTGKVSSQTEVKTTLSMFYGSDKKNFKVVSIKKNGGSEASFGTGVTVKVGTVAISSSSSFSSVAYSLSHTVSVTYSTSATISGKDDFAITLEPQGATSERRVLHFTVNGIRPGRQGDSAVVYSLVPSCSEIAAKKNGDRIPEGNVTCSVVRTSGTSVPEDVTTGFGIKTYVDGTLASASNGLTGSAVAASGVTQSIVYELYIPNTDGTLVDRETIPVVSDGEPGGKANQMEPWFLAIGGTSRPAVPSVTIVSGVPKSTVSGTTVSWNKGQDSTWSESKKYLYEIDKYTLDDGSSYWSEPYFSSEWADQGPKGDDGWTVMANPSPVILNQAITPANGSSYNTTSDFELPQSITISGRNGANQATVNIKGVTVTAPYGVGVSKDSSSDNKLKITSYDSSTAPVKGVLSCEAVLSFGSKSVTLPVSIAFAVNKIGNIKTTVQQDVETTVATKLGFKASGSNVYSIEAAGTYIRSASEKTDTLEQTITDPDTGVLHNISVLSQTASGLTSTVESNVIGKNMFKGTGDGNGWTALGCTLSFDNTQKSFSISDVSSIGYVYSPSVLLEANKTYTISYAYEDAVGSHSMKWDSENRPWNTMRNTYSLTWSTSGGRRYTQITTGNSAVYVSLAVYDTDEQSPLFSMPQLEAGSNMTEWVPNPLYATYSEVKQTADEIDLNIRKGLNRTGINISTGKVAVEADNFTIGKNGTQVFGVDSNTGVTTMQDVDIKGSLIFHKTIIDTVSHYIKNYQFYNEQGNPVSDNYSGTITGCKIPYDTIVIGGVTRTGSYADPITGDVVNGGFRVILPPAKFFVGMRIKIINCTIANAYQASSLSLSRLDIGVVYREDLEEIYIDGDGGNYAFNFIASACPFTVDNTSAQQATRTTFVGAPGPSQINRPNLGSSDKRDYAYMVGDNTITPVRYRSVELVSQRNPYTSEGYAWIIIDAQQ